MHVQAINDAIKDLPVGRIRVHYCYGNYLASHLTEPDYSTVLPELLKLKVGTLVGEMANPRDAGETVIIKNYVKDYGQPKSLKFAAGVIDVKSLFLEKPETVNLKLHNVSDIDSIGPERVLGGTDCGFETLSGLEKFQRIQPQRNLNLLLKVPSLTKNKNQLEFLDNEFHMNGISS